MAVQKGKQYELKEVVLRLAEGQTLYSEQAISNADAAVEVMRKELMQQDREKLCVINLNSKMKAINYNVVSVGNLNQTVADIPFIMKSAICSGAESTILLHTHPSGDPTPSREDVELTKRVVEAGKLIGISCVDHVIVGCGTGHSFSMREHGIVDFDPTYRGIAAEAIMNVAEETGAYTGKEQNMENRTEKKMEEISIKFGKGLAEPFTGKDGKEYMKILIPNADKEIILPGHLLSFRQRASMRTNTERASGQRSLRMARPLSQRPSRSGNKMERDSGRTRRQLFPTGS